MTGWHFHPQVRSGGDLTRGERAADRMRNGMGSWAFVFAALLFLASWMVLNFALGTGAFDGYPYILLNLVLSCVAALQGAILLIAAKRSDQVSSELAQHDYDADLQSRELLTVMQADFAVLATRHAELTAQHAEQGAQIARVLELLEPKPAPATARKPRAAKGDAP